MLTNNCGGNLQKIIADANAHEGHDHSAEAEESGGHAHDSPDSAEECVATEEEYNTGLRIGSIFIILAGSFIGEYKFNTEKEVD